MCTAWKGVNSWRSKELPLLAPVTLGLCIISLDLPPQPNPEESHLEQVESRSLLEEI